MEENPAADRKKDVLLLFPPPPSMEVSFFRRSPSDSSLPLPIKFPLPHCERQSEKKKKKKKSAAMVIDGEVADAVYSSKLALAHHVGFGADGKSMVGNAKEEDEDIFWAVREDFPAVNGGAPPLLPAGENGRSPPPLFCPTMPALGLDPHPPRHPLLRRRHVIDCGQVTSSEIPGIGSSPMSLISSDFQGRMLSDVKKVQEVRRQAADPSRTEMNQFESPATGAEEESVKQLLQVLRITSFDADNAMNQFEKLFSKTVPAEFLDQSLSVPHLHPSSTALARADNSRPNEESSFEFITSPAISNVSAANPSTGIAQRLVPPERDAASEMIYHLLPKKALPEKGKLLQAVMEAGPLLETLLVAGYLPQWRNPPPLLPFQFPSISIRASNSNTEAVRRRQSAPSSALSSNSGGYQIGKRRKF